MSGIKDTATVTLNVNGAQAKQIMSELEAKIQNTEAKISSLKTKISDPKALEAAQKQLKEYQTKLSSLMDKASQTKAAIKDMKDTGASPEALAKARTDLKKYSTEIGHLKTAVKTAQLELKDFEPATLEKARKQLKTYQKQLEEMKSASEGVNKALGNLDTATPRQLEKALRTLNKQLKDMTPGTTVWNDHVEQIKTLKHRLAKVRGELEVQESLWGRIVGWVNRWQTLIVGVVAGSSSIIDVFRSSVDAFADMEQEMANVRKFTGMTEEQVASLNEELKKIDTRSSREDLNKLAQEAGRLGKSSEEDVLGFVRAADKINVALDDLGDGATLTLSKLTGIFGDEERYGTEQSLLKVGSVINELSQNCSASAPYLAQFASRIGGVGAQAGMTIQQIMAFGAVLDSNGQQVEASSTALSQVIVRMMQEPAKYAKVAGLDVKKFSDMLKTDVNGALILFLDTLQKAGGMDVLSPMFKDMGENGSRAIAALSTLATHIDQVKAQQEAANVAFAEGTSIDKEFAVQNETVQAALDKCKNRANELKVELGERLYPLMKHFLTSGAAIMRLLLVSIKYMAENKELIISLSLAIASYSIILKAHAVALKTVALYEATLAKGAALRKASIKAISLLWVMLTGNVQRATAAYKLFNATIKASPMGLLIGGVTLAVGWMMKYAREAKESAAAQKKLAEEQRKYRESLTDLTEATTQHSKEELSRVKILYDTATSERKSRTEREAAARSLINTYPDLFSKMSTEMIMLGNAKSAYDSLTSSILANAKAKAAAEKYNQNMADVVDREVEIRKKEKERLNKLSERDSIQSELTEIASVSGLTTDRAKMLYAELNEANNELYDLNTEITSLYDKLQEILDAADELLSEYNLTEVINNDKSATPTTSPSYISTTQQEKERKKQEAEARRAAAKAKKEFKAQLDAYKAQRSAADREALELYKTGNVNYETLLQKRHENELKFYDDSLAHFEKVFADQKDTYLQDDKDYQKLLLDREKSDERYEKNRIALALESIERRKTAEERNARHMYDVKSDPTLQDEVALQSELYNIRLNALEEKRKLYTEGTKEYADVQFEIESLEQERELELKKLYFAKVDALRKEYYQKSAAERYAHEKAMLDALLKANYLSATQYARYLSALKAKYQPELPGGSDSGWTKADDVAYDKAVASLKDSLNLQLLTKAEFNDRMADLDRERNEKMLASLKATGGEWNSLLSDMFISISSFVKGIDGSAEGNLARLAAGVAAVSAAVNAGMQIATEFAKAEAEIQTKAIEQRYDKEIELAQGNSYKVAKAEKKKEKEIQKIKAESARKEFAMKVIMAIAQSAENALMAYAAGLRFPFPANTVMPSVLAGVAVAQGAVQIALLKKQQQAAEAQGYSKGGFTKPGAVNEPAGVVHAGEWVASQKLLANPVARPMIDALDYAQRTNTIGSLRPDDVSRSIRANDSLVRIAESDGGSALMVAAAVRMSHTVDNLTTRLNEPFVTVNTVSGDKGIKQAQDDYNRLLNNVTPKSKRK